MRRLTWRNLLRTALLATGVSIGLAAFAGQPLLRSTVIAAEELKAATVEEAAKVLDLSTLPLAEGAKSPFGRHLGMVHYEVDGDSKTLFQFHQKQLIKLGWKELPGTTSQAEYISATFQKSGFVVSVASYPGGDPTKAKSAMITLSNLGNVAMSKLPAVKGAKQVFASDVAATYSTAMKPADVATATRKLLTDAGWEPYGANSNPDSEILTFKRNAVRLSVFVGVHPAQKDQVMISYNSALLSADIPAPANAKEVGFDDADKTLRFQTSDSFDTVATFYLERLAKQGWKPDSKELYRSKANDREFGQHDFRNSAKDHMSLLVSDRDGMTHVMLTLQTVADIAALKEKVRVLTAKAAAEEKAQKEAAEAVAKTPSKKTPAEQAAADDDTIRLPIPKGAKKVDQSNERYLDLEFAAGKGKASAEFLRDHLLASGWKIVGSNKIGDESCDLTFTKDGQQLNLDFVENGSDVTVKLMSLEKPIVADAKAKPATKTAAKETAKESDDGFPDVDALIKSAVGDALKDAGLDGKKPAKGTAKAKAADKDAVSVPIPEGAKKVTQTSGNVLQIKWPANKGKASAEALRDQLLAAGWEIEGDAEIEKDSGDATFTKDGKTLTMSFVDTGFTDVNMMLIGIGVKLTEGKADPDAKVSSASSKPETEPSDDDSPKPRKKKIGRKPAKSDDDGDAPVAAPARPAKPNRGIAKLDKLPNEVKLVANGEPVALPHIIAYEIVDNGRWVTRILATETAIKQSSLIDLLRKNGEDHGLRSRSPRVLVELDDQDKLNTMSYAGNGSLGSGRDVTGEAIVEAGRARGTFKANKEDEFFGKTIIGEISFDVPVLTRDSQPAKQLADAKNLETSGKLLVSDKPIKLGNVVAYEVKIADEIQTAIFFTEKPINIAKLKASLAKDASDDGLFEPHTQVKILIDRDDKPSSMNLWHDNASMSGNSNLIGDVVVEDGRARGTVKLSKPDEFLGKTYSFDLTFDVEVLKLPSTAKE